MKTYQIVKMYNICGRQEECLCDIPTASGHHAIYHNEEIAKTRVTELQAMGHTSARYEEVPEQDQWWNNPTNF